MIRKDLRVVVCSATLDAEHLRDFFNAPSALHSREHNATIVSIEGRMYPVEIAYLEQPTENYITSAVVTVMEIHLTVGTFTNSCHDLAGSITFTYTQP